MKPDKSLLLLILLLAIFSCRNKPGTNCPVISELPVISPDYTQVTIPVNIAPLNFSISTTGEDCYVEISGSKGKAFALHPRNGQVIIPVGKWKNLLAANANDSIHFRIFEKKNGVWARYPEFSQYVSDAPIDRFLYYRMLYPGYESWSEISIVQRSLENFAEKTVVQNNTIDQNCVNCHAFNRNNPGDFMIHVRGSHGGTLFLKDGALTKFNLKTAEMENSAVYPRWHPSGKYVAFASNKVIQQFHALAEKRIEVSDLNSSLVLFDLEKNEMMDIPCGDKKVNMDTYPEWSPDGKMLYFCRADAVGKDWDYTQVRYNLYRIPFDPAQRAFGQPELLLDAAKNGKSVSFPRVSPDGKQIVFTRHDYGCFPIWHKEADLYSLVPGDSVIHRMALNSDQTDSYHSWSENSRWLVFSSKRGDGLTARPYIACVDEQGNAHKPFVLPQQDPGLYDRLIKSFNVPELSNAEVSFLPEELRKAAAAKAIPVLQGKAQSGLSPGQ